MHEEPSQVRYGIWRSQGVRVRIVGELGLFLCVRTREETFWTPAHEIHLISR